MITVMNIAKLNEWLEEVERARFFLPESEVAEDAEDIIDYQIEAIRSMSLDRIAAFGEINKMQQVVREILIKFDIYV